MRLRTRRITRIYIAAITAFLIVQPNGDQDVNAADLLVSSFFSDTVGRYNLSTGAFLAPLDPSGGLDGPLATRIGPDGLLYVASEESNEILRYQVQTGIFVDTFIGSMTPGLDGPSGMAWDAAGNLYVPSFNNDSILKFDGQSGALLGTFASGSGLNGPDNGTIVGPDGMLYVPSYFNNRILRYDLDSGQSEVFIAGILRPRVLVFHTDGLLYVTSETADAVQRYTSDGEFVDDFIQPGPTILDVPVGLAYDDGFWYVSSIPGDNVLKFDDAGDLVDADFISSGLGGIDGPVFLTVVPEPTSFAWLLLMSTWWRWPGARVPAGSAGH